MFISSLFEEAKPTAVLAYGRFNPPTIGHQKLIDKVLSIPGDHFIVVSHTQDNKKNPLTAGEKLVWLNLMYPGKNCFYAASPESPTIITWASDLFGQGYSDLVVVCGDDRVAEFTKLLEQYNGISTDENNGYAFDSIKVVSSGERDPDADGVEGMSASKMRGLAVAGDTKQFALGLHPAIKQYAAKIMSQIKSSLKPQKGITEMKKLTESNIHDGMKVKLHPDYADHDRDEIYTVSQCDEERRKCWIGDKDGRGWMCSFSQLIPARGGVREDVEIPGTSALIQKLESAVARMKQELKSLLGESTVKEDPDRLAGRNLPSLIRKDPTSSKAEKGWAGAKTKETIRTSLGKHPAPHLPEGVGDPEEGWCVVANDYNVMFGPFVNRQDAIKAGVRSGSLEYLTIKFGKKGSMADPEEYVATRAVNPVSEDGGSNETYFKLLSPRATSILQSLRDADKVPSVGFHGDVISAGGDDVQTLRNELIRQGAIDDFEEVVDESALNAYNVDPASKEMLRPGKDNPAARSALAKRVTATRGIHKDLAQHYPELPTKGAASGTAKGTIAGGRSPTAVVRQDALLNPKK